VAARPQRVLSGLEGASPSSDQQVEVDALRLHGASVQRGGCRVIREKFDGSCG
jgi:hypothetical protein